MFGSHYYHKLFPKAITAFGSLFNNIHIIVSEPKGKKQVKSQIEVPLSYSPKRKFLEDIRRRNTNSKSKDQVIALSLPQMSFEIIGLNYDPERMLQKAASLHSRDTNQKFFTRVPYNVQWQLNVATRSYNEGFQIMEQIFPNFHPTYTFKVYPIEGNTEIYDEWSLILNGVSFLDDADGALEKRRELLWVLDFEMKMNFYGEDFEAKIIDTANVNFANGLFDFDSPSETLTVTSDSTIITTDEN